MKFGFNWSNVRYMQYCSAVTATLSVASFTHYVLWASPTLPKLTSNNSPIGTKLTDEEASWVAAIVLLGVVPGSILAGWMADTFGRRATLLFSAIPLFVPWIVTIYAKSALLLILIRFVAGFGGAIVMGVVPLYIGEIAEKDIRGKLATTFNLLNISGSIFVLSLGPFVSYEALTWSCSVFPIVFAVLFYFMPESPYFLVKIGKIELARNNLKRLSYTNIDENVLDTRLEEIKVTVEFDMRNKSTLWELLTKQEYRKSLIIILGVRTLQQLSGVNAIDSYMQTIIESSSSSISPEISSVIFGVIQLPAVLVAAAIVDKTGRKLLLIVSAIGCAIPLIAEGIYFYLQDVAHKDVSNISWLPTLGLTLYTVMTPIGVMTAPYILLGEIFTTNVKSIAASVATFYAGILAFLSIKFFKPISEAWGMFTMFWIFAGVCILGSVLAFLLLPETKGKTFTEIQEKLNKKRTVTRRSSTLSKI